MTDLQSLYDDLMSSGLTKEDLSKFAEYRRRSARVTIDPEEMPPQRSSETEKDQDDWIFTCSPAPMVF